MDKLSTLLSLPTLIRHLPEILKSFKGHHPAWSLCAIGLLGLICVLPVLTTVAAYVYLKLH